MGKTHDVETVILSNAREAIQKRLRPSEGWRSAQASRTSSTPVEVFEAGSTALSPLLTHSSSHAAKQLGWRWYLCNSCISPSPLNSASSSIRFRCSVSPHRAHASPHPGPPMMRSGLRVGSFPFWIASRAFSRRGRPAGVTTQFRTIRSRKPTASLRCDPMSSRPRSFALGLRRGRRRHLAHRDLHTTKGRRGAKRTGSSAR